MDFNFTETQTMLRDTLRRYLANAWDFDRRQAALRSPLRHAPEVWQALAGELGILGAAFPERFGGLDGGPVENMVILEELGRAIACEPYVPTVVVGGHALVASGGALAEALIPGIIRGEVIIAFAWAERQARYNIANIRTRATADGAGWTLSGEKAVVLGAPRATHLLVTARTGGADDEPDGISLFLVPADAPGIARRDYLTVDGHLASELAFERTKLGPEALLGADGGALPLLSELFDRAVAATCAEASGAMRHLHELTLEHARQRVQFGQPIAKFQVIQHRLVDMFLEVEQAVSVTYMATLKLGLAAPERARAVSQAKARIARGARFLGQSAIQIHGGIGITEELAAGHYFKRLTMLEQAYGDADFHFGRIEGALLAEAA